MSAQVGRAHWKDGPVTGWRVYIEATPTQMAALERHMAHSDVLIARDQDADNYLSGPATEAFTEPHEVFAWADELLPVLNLVGHLPSNDSDPLAIIKVQRVGEPGMYHRFEGRVEVTTHVVGSVSGGTPAPPDDLVARLDGELRRDPDFHKAVELFTSGELDWVRLWKVRELLLQSAGSVEEFTRRSNWDDATWKAFEAGVNDPRVSGDAARHAVPQRPAVPPRVMKLDEARREVRLVLLRWVEDR